MPLPPCDHDDCPKTHCAREPEVAAGAPGSELSFDEFWAKAPASETPRTDAAKAAYIDQALPITNIFEPMGQMEREAAKLRKALNLAAAALVSCHSAMLGKVNPKSPAWQLLYVAEDAVRDAQNTQSDSQT